ncbi:MAG: hypothetical protein SNJ68_02840 [Cyanobacteriota bacterium]
MRQAFVASLKLKDTSEIAGILHHHFPNTETTYFFLRWPHQVSGIQSGIPHDFTCQEGQVFALQAELRWKKTVRGLDLLYLGTQSPATSFTPLSGEWRYEDYEADLYGNPQNQETRFPKSFDYSKALEIGQRYFIDSVTARVHFIALIPR